MKRISEYIFLWALGGSIYYLLEIGLRGFSHWSMFILGGLALCFCTYQGEVMHWTEGLWIQVIRATVFVTSLEFITGIIVNKYFQLAVWDYSDQPLNLWGQICVPFMILFSALIVVAIWLGAIVGHKIYGKEKPNIFVL